MYQLIIGETTKTDILGEIITFVISILLLIVVLYITRLVLSEKGTEESLTAEVAERKRLEAELRQAVERLMDENAKTEAMIAAVGDNITIQDTQFNIVFQNQFCKESWGEHVGEKCFKAYQNRDEVCEDCQLVGTFKDGKIITIEKTIATPSGTACLEITSSPVKDSTGKVIAGIELFRDITERKRIEAEIKEINARLQTLIRAIPDVVFFKDLSGRYLIANKAVEEFTGLSEKEIIGKTDAELLPPDLVENCKKSDEEVMRNRRIFHFEETYAYGDGKEKFLDTIKAPIFDNDGNIAGLVGVSRDITGHKQLDNLLKKSEEKYKNLVELTSDIIYISDRDGNHIFMNDAGYKTLGFTPEEIIGKPWIELIHPDDIGKSHDEFKKTIEQGVDVFDFENRYISKNGAVINAFHNIRILRNEKGEIVGAQGIARDITRLKRNEENMALFSRVIEMAMDGVQITDISGNIFYSNSAVEKMYGYSDQELIGANVNEMNVDKEISGKVIIPSIKEAGHWNGELMVRHKTGREFPVWLSASMVRDAEGRPVAMVGIIRDITERKRMEDKLAAYSMELEDLVYERTREIRRINEELIKEKNKYEGLFQEFHTLLEAIPDILLLLSSDLKVLWANRAAAASFDLNVHEIAGQYCYQLWHESNIPCRDCHALRCFITGKEEDSNMTTAKGRFFNSRSFPIKDENGVVKSVIIVANDVTEKAAMQEEAMRNNHLASLGELAAGVAHEINNPLNGIINYAQILTDKLNREGKEKGIAERIMKEGNRIAVIVKGLLSFARPGKEDKSRAHIEAILSDSLNLTGTQIRKDGIKLKVDIPHNLPEIIARTQQIQQVFLNVINNARYALNQKHHAANTLQSNANGNENNPPSPPFSKGGMGGFSDKTVGEKILKITGEAITIDERQYVRISFYDNGSGIPADMLNKVMNPFFTTKPSGKGTGLGLSISHGIIADHGGKIAINSIEGEFTEVTIDLPSL